jgi:outer membrane receptor protein involved in Fe transport
MDAFLRATANSFSITLGQRRSLIDQRALAAFGQDQIAIGDDLRIDLGLRYEWHVTPVERDDRFIVFDRATASLIRVGRDVPRIYQQNNANVEPRVGVTWSLPGDGNTVVRAAYGHAVDQPVTTAVRDTASNPPFGVPLTATGDVPLGAAIETARPRAFPRSRSIRATRTRACGPGTSTCSGSSRRSWR